jgi:chromate transport protein ChrA
MVVAVGTVRAGPLGGMLAFLFFVFPAAAVMTFAGQGAVQFLDYAERPSWLELSVDTIK